ncbi:ATP-binding protein [Actinomycetospora cinnamomea]|uniref:Serine/threonine-protein kinase RsbW n=1 Tax=Actinomycetospora cinnamomea TaxID=663609 RepID=A0A2U1F854_9PSEU|nr:ATP-binding protein [Actinomycetospora cinnamomea]PVZ08160.1 serine/threonine-protein kinase RsbW [Actinomycetospora cinnamomea]
MPRLHRQAGGTASSVGVLRRALRRWLVGVLDDEDAIDDLTLAASEALENAADHAFVGRGSPGTITVSAEVEHGSEARAVVVTVADDGCWRPPSADPGHRGRGLAMIARLAGAHCLVPGRDGTSITLRHAC